MGAPGGQKCWTSGCWLDVGVEGAVVDDEDVVLEEEAVEGVVVILNGSCDPRAQRAQ